LTGRRKGIRVLDRTSALAVVASHLALLDAAHDEADADRVGVVLGTGCGSQQSLYQFIQDTYTAEQPHQISPEMFPRTVMNYAAGQVGIWFGLKALNTTISAGRMAGLLALRYATRMLRCGYADRVLVGSVQEFSPEAAWIAHHMAASRGDRMSPLGEGAAMFVLDRNSSDRRKSIELAACEVATTSATDPASLAACLTRCIQVAIRKSGLRTEDIWAVATRSADALTPLDAEGAALAAVLGNHRPAHLHSAQSIVGDAYSASGSLQLGMLLALFRTHEVPATACGLVTSISHQGMAGCALFQMVTE
jgi:3-oxoacyl-[acyl-carrier-protein] synthase II